MTKRLIIILIFATIPFTLTGMGSEENYDQMITSLLKESVLFIQTEDLYKMLQENESLILLDTREFHEYNISHIKNARFAGYKSFNLESIKDIDKDIKALK